MSSWLDSVPSGQCRAGKALCEPRATSSVLCMYSPAPEQTEAAKGVLLLRQ